MTSDQGSTSFAGPMAVFFVVSLIAPGGIITGCAFGAEPKPVDAAAYAKEHGLEPTMSLDLGNGVALELVLIPAGKFVMGSPAEEKYHSDDETQHEVTISNPFYMGKYEVTQEQYEEVMGSNPSQFKGPKNPVETGSWNEAQEFCKKLGAKTSKTIKLPTEAQWEYACRAGSTTAYCFGEGENGLADYAWYDGNSGRRTHPVGEKKPNSWGLYDMHGNVWEWCQDWYGHKYYAESPKADPLGPAKGAEHVLRGGSWDYDPVICRSAYRRGYAPIPRTLIGGLRVVVLVETRTP
ncbi:MAG: formylglycine-generating enzyme family protein [Planctomycetota bacterium]